MKTEQDKLSPYTSQAIMLFEDFAKSERRTEQKEMEWKATIHAIPERDISEYVRITNEIQKREEDKLNTYIERMQRRR